MYGLTPGFEWILEASFFYLDASHSCLSILVRYYLRYRGIPLMHYVVSFVPDEWLYRLKYWCYFVSLTFSGSDVSLFFVTVILVF